MFCEFFGLREQPFGVTPDERFLYLSHTHRETFASLTYRLQSGRGFVGVVAPPGMGKTTLLFRLLQDLRETARTAFIFQTQCTPLEFMRHLVTDLELGVAAEDPFRLYQLLKASLLREAGNGRQIVIVIDEAQNLSNVVLEQIRLLSDIETPRAKLLQIVLSGQPQLATKLAQPDLLQLHQRFSIICNLKPFSLLDSTQYIEHRLQVAGRSGPPLFSRGAIEEVARLSGGVPRLINNICFGALSAGFASRARLIGVEQVREGAADLRLISETSIPSDSSHRSAPDNLVDRNAINILRNEISQHEAGIEPEVATAKASAQHAPLSATKVTPLRQAPSRASDGTFFPGRTASTIEKELRSPVTRTARIAVAAIALLLTGFLGFRFMPRHQWAKPLPIPAASEIALPLSHKPQHVHQPLPRPQAQKSNPSILENRHPVAEKSAPISRPLPPEAIPVSQSVSATPAIAPQPKPASQSTLLEAPPVVTTPGAQPVLPISISQHGSVTLSPQETTVEPGAARQGAVLISFPDSKP
jgi:general secretion pathway protein A